MKEPESSTYAVFGDGSVTRLLFSLLPHSGSPDPIELVPIDITDPDIKMSARMAVYSAYAVLNEQGLLGAERFCFAYQFEESGKNILGKSAGLAFALKFAQEVLHLRCDLAATGRIETALPTAKVGAVESIDAKLAAASQSLPDDVLIFYPQENNLSSNFPTTRVVPVDTLEQALRILTTQTMKPPSITERFLKRARHWVLPAIMIPAFYCAGGLYLQYHLDNKPLQKGLFEQCVSYVYPWVDPYLVLSYSSKESSIAAMLAGPDFVEKLKEKGWMLTGEIEHKSRSRLHKNGRTFEVFVELRDSRLKIKDTPLKDLGLLEGRGKGENFESAAKAAVHDLRKRLLNRVEKS